MIQLENVKKAFSLSRQQRRELGTDARELVAVDNISITCHPGRIFSLLGPNGAGKTTTLRMIATILQPTAGTIKVNGFDTKQQGGQVRASIGFLTGSTGLYQRLTPNELIAYFGNLYKVDSDSLKSRKKELFDLLHMHDFADKRIGQLSTGMKQKVSIARTMIHDPDVVVLDEPTSGLDVITAENIISLIRRCREQQKTVIFSSHIMSEVDLLCDDLAIIHDGRLIHESTMEEFRSQHAGSSLTEAFIKVVEAA